MSTQTHCDICGANVGKYRVPATTVGVVIHDRNHESCFAWLGYRDTCGKCRKALKKAIKKELRTHLKSIGYVTEYFEEV